MIEFQFRRGLSIPAIFKSLKKYDINYMLVKRTVDRLRDTGSVKDRPRSGRPRNIRTMERIKRIREKIRRNPVRSGNKMAKEENTSKTSMRRLLNVDLGVRPYRKRKIHGLKNVQKDTRLKRSKLLAKRHAGGKLEKIIFSDEKLFVMEQSHNSKNDVVYSTSIEAIPENLRNVQRYQNKSSVMVWGGVSKKGKIPLKFIPRSISINGDYYRNTILEKVMVPGAKKLYPDGGWIYQQDSAPAHSAKATQKWLEDHSPGFITKDEWPPSSPDLNPLDYCVWGMLEARVNAKQHRSLAAMEAAIRREWDKMSMDVIRAAIDGWPGRLLSVVERNGDRFE